MIVYGSIVSFASRLSKLRYITMTNFVCAYCKTKYAAKFKLRQHIKQTHPGKELPSVPIDIHRKSPEKALFQQCRIKI